MHHIWKEVPESVESGVISVWQWLEALSPEQARWADLALITSWIIGKILIITADTIGFVFELVYTDIRLILKFVATKLTLALPRFRPNSWHGYLAFARQDINSLEFIHPCAGVDPYSSFFKQYLRCPSKSSFARHQAHGLNTLTILVPFAMVGSVVLYVVLSDLATQIAERINRMIFRD